MLLSIFHLHARPVQDFIAEGYSAAQLVSQIHDRIVNMDSIRDKEKSVIAERLGVG